MSAPDAEPATELTQLAERFGILGEYTDNDHCRRITSTDTRRALLCAMGCEASTDAAVGEALDAARVADARRLLAPLGLARSRSGAAPRVSLSVPPGWGGQRTLCHLELLAEDGSESALELWRTLPAAGRSFTLSLPEDPGPGYHRVRATLSCATDERQGEQQLIVHPGRCAMPLADGERVFGIWANLYSLRSKDNWGCGDFGDLARLCSWAGSLGATFTGINPLHALHNEVDSSSPYSPVSRVFLNPLYIDLEALPEFGAEGRARDALEQPSVVQALGAARQRTQLDYRALWQLKRPLLLLAYQAFVARHGDGDDGRAGAWLSWCAQRGESLDSFATFMALADARSTSGGPGRDWRHWPGPLQDPHSDAVNAFRRQHQRTVDFHRWLQFVADQQLARAAGQAQTAGQGLGLYQDLAIGTPAWAADTWARQELFVEGVSIGCPPDAFADEGQDWNLTPLSPAALQQHGWRYWREVLHASMAHSGVLRIDHVMGLFRQYWIPAGASAKDGAYVRYPSDVLLAILALESSRNNVLVVGEDLGTVPRGLPARLARQRILCTRVALFERDRRGAFPPSEGFPRRALLTANTHDLPPLDALWSDDDLRLRRRLGQIPDDETLDEARHDRRELLAALRRRVFRDGSAASARTKTLDGPDQRQALRRAVYRWLSATPAALLGISLDDLCGETEPVNIPGVGEEAHASWCRRMAVSLEDLPELPGLPGLLADLRERGERQPTDHPE